MTANLAAGHVGAAALAVAVSLALAGQGGAAECPAGQASLRWDGGGARFAVEIADTAAERAQGLMFRETMPAGAGMLFVYDRPQDVAFWMKNTLIPLDLVFIGETGRVLGVHARAVPGDLTPIPGPEGSRFVLEINGGLAGRLGLRAGAELQHPAVDQGRALWPCGAS